MPLIKCSVIIPTFNREATIEKALQYFDDDFYLNGEVIVVDDASQDETCSLIEKKFPQIKLIKHKDNKGAAAARNTGIKASRGEYVAFLDSDDLWYPHKLSKQLSYFEKLDPSVGAIFSAYHYNKKTTQTRTFNKVDDWFEYFLKGCFISPGSGLLVKRRIFDEIGFFDENMRRLEDWDWLLRLSRHYSLDFINEPLFCVNYSGRPNPKAVLDSIDILKEKWLKEMSLKNTNLFNTTVVLEKLLVTRGNLGIFLKILLRDVICTPKIFLGLLLRVLFEK